MAKKMTFNQAKSKLHKIAGGKYHVATIESMRFDNNNGVKNTSRTLYIEGMAHYEGHTWEEAFEKLQDALNNSK